MGSGFAEPGFASTVANEGISTIDRDLPFVSEDALWSEHDQQDQSKANEGEGEGLHLGALKVRQHERTKLLQQNKQRPEEARAEDGSNHRSGSTEEQRGPDPERRRAAHRVRRHRLR